MNVSANDITGIRSVLNDIQTPQSSVDHQYTATSSFFNQRCESVGDSFESASSTTSNHSTTDIDQFNSYSNLAVVNPLFGFSNFPTNYCQNPQNYYPTNYWPGNQLINSKTESRSSSVSSTSGTLTSAARDSIAAAAAASAAAAGTSSASSSSSVRSNSTSGATTALSNDSSSAAGTTSSSTADDHLQRLAQMTHGVGIIKPESDNSDATVAAVANLTADAYQTAAAAAYAAQAQAYGNWQNYYQFNNQMAPAAAAFPGWPGQCYPPSHWAQTKKGRQTYQRYQTSVLEGKFQQSSYVSKKQREELRLQTNLTDRQIKIWFQNRRMKAKKEKNRCDEQTDQQTLIPANPPKNMMQGSNGNLHQQNHLGGLIDDPLGLGIDQDKLKNNPGMLAGPQGQMWCQPVNMNGASGMHGMVSMADTMASWPMLPHSQLHSQNSVNHPHYSMGYPICHP